MNAKFDVIKRVDNISEFNMVDACKLLMSFSVIAAHTNMLKDVGNIAIQNISCYLQEVCTMFFYVATGFFMLYKMPEPYSQKELRINLQIKKLFKMYVVWTMLSLPVIIYGYIISGKSFIHCLLSFVKYFLFVGKLYNAHHLYFLLACMIALFLMRIMIKKECGMGMYLVAAYAVYTVNGCLMSLINSDFDLLIGIGRAYRYLFNEGAVFTGMAYIALGALIAESRVYLNKWVCIVGLILIQILGETGWLHLLKPMLLFMLVMDIRLPDHKIWKELRNISTLVYCSHLIVYSAYTFGVIQIPNKQGMEPFIVTVIFSCILAIVLLKLKNKVKWVQRIFF